MDGKYSFSPDEQNLLDSLVKGEISFYKVEKQTDIQTAIKIRKLWGGNGCFRLCIRKVQELSSICMLNLPKIVGFCHEFGKHTFKNS